MDILIDLETRGLQKVVYEETRDVLSSIQFPDDDIPRPACGTLLYVRS